MAFQANYAQRLTVSQRVYAYRSIWLESGMSEFRQRVRAGDYVFREGDPPGIAFLVDQGKVEVSTLQAGKRIILSYLGPGDLLGEMAVIDDAPRSADARAVEDCTLTEIKREQIHERLAEADPIIRVLMHSLLQRYRSGLSIVRGTTSQPLVGASVDAKLGDGAIRKFRLESQLISAIKNDELSVVFQPLFDVAQNRVVGFEALTRWVHPERGQISPTEFIALAEETSLILPVGQYALRKSFQALKALEARFDYAFVAVNVSARQSVIPHFAELVVSMAHEHEIAPHRLELEITESLTLDYQHVRALINTCHKHGIRVSLDDFGTGFSNLGHLHELAFNTVKLDQAFTRQLVTNARCCALARGIVNMIHSINCKVIAEGVETREQAEMLRGMGAEYFQGWLIGKPSAASEMPAFLDKQGY